MSQGYKIPQPTLPKKASSHIKSTVPPDKTVDFNFKYLNEGSGGKFRYSNRGNTYLTTLLERFRAYSQKTRRELESASGMRDSMRAHPIDFTDSRCTERGFGLPRELEQEAAETAFQLSLTKKKHGRAHGYFIGSTFHVVWLDPCHNLYGRGNQDMEEDMMPDGESFCEVDLADCYKELKDLQTDRDEVYTEFMKHLDECGNKPTS